MRGGVPGGGSGEGQGKENRPAHQCRAVEQVRDAPSIIGRARAGSPAETPALVEAFSRPWVLNLGDDVRLRTLVRLAGRDSSSCRQALAAYEVSPEWSRQVLLARARCYAQVAPELVAFAQADLARYESQEEQEFSVSRRSRDAEPDNGGEGHPTPAHDAEAAAAPATVPTQHSAPFEVGPASR